MSKHETSNQFNNGLMMDVHPLQTPNTVLTDCLNGTFITYNGNEHVLQNDMGNYKLEKCKLKENYIPIGTASYGDILYIASYNPIDKKFELGSYPSPLQWNTSGVQGEKPIMPSIISSAIQHWKDSHKSEETPTLLYSEMEQFSYPIVLDEYKINPGDRYKISEEGENTTIESLEYFIMDENKVTHKVNIHLNNSTDDDGFWPTSWEIPGYLYVKNRVLAPNNHKFKITSAQVGKNSVTFNLQSIIDIDDINLINNLDKFCKNLYVEISDNHNLDKSIYWNDLNPQDDDKTYHLNSVTWLLSGKRLILEYEPYVITNLDLFKTEIVTDDEGNEIETEIPQAVELKLNCNLYYKDTSSEPFNLYYDTIFSQSISYTANGKNQQHVAQDCFYWTSNKENTKYEITVDVVGDGDCYAHAVPIDECSLLKIDSIQWEKLENGKFTIEYPKDCLYAILFKFGEKINSIEDITGRFAYFNLSCDKVMNARADLLLSLNSIVKTIFGKPLCDSYKFSDFTPKYDSFLNQYYKYKNNDEIYAAIAGSNYAGSQNEIVWTSNKQDVSEQSLNVESDFWRNNFNRKTLYSLTETDPQFVDKGKLTPMKKTTLVNISSQQTWWKRIKDVSGTLDFQQIYLYWVHEYNELQAGWFRKGTKSDSSKWLDYCFVGGNDPYQDSDDSRFHEIAADVLNSLENGKIGLLYVGAVKNNNAGARMVITTNTETDVIWSVDDKGTQGSWHIMLSDDNGKILVFKPGEQKDSLPSTIMETWIKSIRNITWKKPSFNCLDVSDFLQITPYFGHSIKNTINNDISGPTVYEAFKLTSSTPIGQWMLYQLKTSEVLGELSNITWDPMSKIEKLNSNEIIINTITSTSDQILNPGDYTFTEDWTFNGTNYSYLSDQLQKTYYRGGREANAFYLIKDASGKVPDDIIGVTHALYLDANKIKMRDWAKVNLRQATYYFRTQKASNPKKWRVLTGPLKYYYGKY